MKANCNIIIYILCGAFLFCPLADAGDAQDHRAGAPAGDPVIEMEPYVVKGERILPNPESWVYINIPAVEIKRNNRVVYMPGYEILSSRSRQNSLALAGELQLRQVANALVFPDFVRALPRFAIIVVLDDGRLRDNVRANIWEGDSLYTATALRQSSGRADSRYSIGTQINTHFYSDFVTEIPSGYDGHANREMPDADNERAVRDSRTVANLVGIAANGGPLTVYLDDTRDFPRLYREPKFGDDDFSVVARTLQVTGSLLRDIRMNGDGRVPESVFGRELSQRLVLLARQVSVRNEPGWLRAGFGSLCRDIRVSPRQIEFGEFRQYLNMNFDPPRLVDVLNGKRPFPSIRNGREVAKVFVHYCLFASNGAQSARFRNFINRLDEEPFSEALFEECFGKKVSAFESDVISHWHLMTPKKRVIYKWDTPPLPGIVAREATQSEVARLKAEMLIARGQSPKALDELRTAYWRGGRDPWMLALLALLEEHIGSIPRAEKITKTLLALPQAPARAQVVAAKLRMRELGAWEDDGKKLDKAGADSIRDLLVKARLGGLLNEDLCATLSKLVIKSAESPSTDIAAFIKEAAKRYPLNKTIQEAFGMRGAATAGGLPARRRPPRNQSRSP